MGNPLHYRNSAYIYPIPCCCINDNSVVDTVGYAAPDKSRKIQENLPGFLTGIFYRSDTLNRTEHWRLQWKPKTNCNCPQESELQQQQQQ